MNGHYDWQMLAEDALAKLGELQKSNRGNVYQYLLEAAAIVAGVVCEVEQRFSILELFSIDGGDEYDAYKIVFANPLESEDSPRHGASEVGMLRKPCDKVALISAISEQKVVVANNVAENPLTQYIGKHIERKKLRHMAVLPCRGYLLLFDRVACSNPFNEGERAFLSKAARLIQFGFRWYTKDEKKNDTTFLKNILLDRIGNPVTIIGGFYKRLEEALAQSSYDRALSYAEIIAQAGGRLVSDLSLFQEIRSFLLESQDEKSRVVRELFTYLSIFESVYFEIDATFLEHSFWINHSEKIAKQLFSRIQRFMLGNREDHDLFVTLGAYDSISVTLEFHCTGFKGVKSEIDEGLLLIRLIAEVLGGKTDVKDNVLLLTLPLAEGYHEKI